MRATRGIFQALGLAAIGVLGLAGAASAQVTEDDVGLNDSFEQTSDSVANESGAFFAAHISFTNIGDYAGGTLELPSTDTRTLVSFGSLGYQYEDTATTLTTLQMTYGTGIYTFKLTGSGQPDATVAQSYAGDAYSNKALVTNYSALQGVNASSVTFDLNGMMPSMNATQSNIYLYVYNASTNALVYNSGQLSSTTTMISLPTLTPGTNYYYNLEYDDRIFGTANDGAIAQYQIYDLDTNGNFFTAGAVPEPSTWAMMLVGFVGLGYVGYRGSRRKSAIAA
jgi:PEP-CTERM motif